MKFSEEIRNKLQVQLQKSNVRPLGSKTEPDIKYRNIILLGNIKSPSLAMK